MSQSLFPVSNEIRGARFPDPADPAQAQRGLEQWLESDDAAPAHALAASPDGRRVLAAIFGNSAFLTHCCLREPAFLGKLLAEGPSQLFEPLLTALEAEAGSETDTALLMRHLRVARSRVALLVALADIGGIWELEQVTGALSRFAGIAVNLAARHLLSAAADSGQIVLPEGPEPERDSGLVILGMGKLGAFELNYSSDIDLIILFDPEKIQYRGRDSTQQCFVRLAQNLVRILEQRTGDGYVFRTDLRLRPDPASTPLALSVRAALGYYESTGQNWERAAMIKARPVAGDLAAGQAFLLELQPFLWRRHLDFAAIADIHSIKRQINAHRGGHSIAVAGHNLKLGRGGIREIEFFAQTQQLIWGGRMPELRLSGTCITLQALRQTHRISADTETELILAYRFLRRAEHRLQMVDDAQTHSLPRDAEGLARIATFLGYESAAAFAAELQHHLSRVEKRYAELFEEAPSLAGPGNLVFTGTEDDPETLATIQKLGFMEPPMVAATIRGWHHGRYRAMRSQRAREILTEIIPPLLKSFGATANPDFAWRRFDQFLGRLPAGVPLFSLFHADPALLDLVADIMGAAPRLADRLAERPHLLDGVLAEGFFGAPPDRAALAAEFERLAASSRDYADILDLARRFAHDRRFQIGVNLLRAHIDGETAGEALADLAEVVIAGLLPRVTAEFARSHGEIPGGSLLVLGLGKLGGREMTVASDLDLILIYDAPPEAESSNGGKKLPVATYYARLCQRLINALTVPTAEGQLYEVDMRLRPSGNAGPIASSLAAFEQYQTASAWTWEHMALTRARPIAGNAALKDRVMAIVTHTLTQVLDPDRLVLDIADMRGKIAAQHRGTEAFDLKYRPGGLIDAEFITQYLQLRHAAAHPETLHPNTTEALAALAKAGVLAPDAAAEIIAAMRLWRRLQALLKLMIEGTLDEKRAPEALKSALARAAEAIDFPRLKADISAAAECVHGHFVALIEGPAETARQKQEKQA